MAEANYANVREAANVTIEYLNQFCDQVLDNAPGIRDAVNKIKETIQILGNCITPTRETIILLSQIIGVVAAGTLGGILVNIVHEKFADEDSNDLEPEEIQVGKNIEELKRILGIVQDQLRQLVEKVLDYLEGKANLRTLQYILGQIRVKIDTCLDLYEITSNQLDNLQAKVKRRETKYRRLKRLFIGIGVAGGVLFGVVAGFGIFPLALPLWLLVGGGVLGLAVVIGAAVSSTFLKKPPKHPKLDKLRLDLKFQGGILKGCQNDFSYNAKVLDAFDVEAKSELNPTQIIEGFDCINGAIRNAQNIILEERCDDARVI